ncbi:MAG: hypothetical protein DI533_14100 [Cereibacter sphaeroides]|uniref:Uncharacterized protein n=1 Tax=Cereibacter sphaeroides TaxID=1063 RepID=A0A2W5S4Q9_CERSP|nr:MAG: hypothetical protein DI533_14100 [Cereibacter sphaeroides]
MTASNQPLSLDLDRMSAKVTFDKKFMPPGQFAREHGLIWMGKGSPFFHYETVRASFCDEPALRLGNIYV